MKCCLFCFAMQNKVVYTDGTIIKISAAVVFLAVHVVCSYLCWWSHISGHFSSDPLYSPLSKTRCEEGIGKKNVIALIGWSCCERHNAHLWYSERALRLSWLLQNGENGLITKQTTQPLRHHHCSSCLNWNELELTWNTKWSVSTTFVNKYSKAAPPFLCPSVQESDG